MLSLVVGLCLLGGLSAQVPDVSVKYENGELSFAVKHFVGLKRVHIHYQSGSDVGEVIPREKSAVRERSSWVLKVKDLTLTPGDSVQYSVTVWGPRGKVHGLPINWVYVPALSYGPRRLRGAVIFRDDFNGGHLDRNNWDIEVSMYGGFNWEFQVYDPESYNVKTENGHLVLKPTLTIEDPRWDENWLTTGVMDMQALYGQCTQSERYGCHREGKYGILPPVMSGKIKSRPVLKYGTVEVRARVPKGCWIWPAIWMLPRDSAYGDWPRSGEIDIMETRGNVEASGHGINQVSSTLHWGSSGSDNHYTMTTATKDAHDWSTDFHTWRLEWTHDKIETFVDDQRILSVHPPQASFASLAHTSNIWGNGPMAPFDKEFYAIFNVAVGGTNGFFPDNWNYGSCPKPWSNDSPTGPQDFWNKRSSWLHSWQGDKVAMLIDYIEFRHL